MAGGKVLLSEGGFGIASALDIPLFTILEGQTPMTDGNIAGGTVLQKSAAGVTLIDLESANRANRIGRTTIKHLTLYGNATDGEAPGIAARYADLVVLEGVSFRAIYGYALRCEECWDWRLPRVEFSDCGDVTNSKAQVYLLNGDDDNCNQFDFDSCRWEGCNWTAFEASHGGASPTGNYAIHFRRCKFHGKATPHAGPVILGGFAKSTIDKCFFWGFSAEAVHLNNGLGGAVGSQNVKISKSDLNVGPGVGDSPIIRSDADWTKIVDNHLESVTGDYYIELEAGADRSLVTGNTTWNTAALKPLVNDASAGSIVRDNPTYVTENAGTGTLPNAGPPATVVIAHGCDYTPAAADIVITPTENPTNTPGLIWVDTIGAANFTVNCENDPGASALDFSWAVRRV